eukprot:COSAG02_NODE_510_length_20863_cov_139.455233_20_plen_97_part_00
MQLPATSAGQYTGQLSPLREGWTSVLIWGFGVLQSGGWRWGGLLQQQVNVLSRVVYKSMNKSRTSEDRSNKATLLLTVLCSLLSRLQRIYRSQYFD